MKKTTIIIILIILAGGAWLLANNNKSSSDNVNSDNLQTQTELSGDAVAKETGNANEVANDGSETQDGNVKEFVVEGFNFAFSLNEIRVKKGDKVKIVFKNTGGYHDFNIDEFSVKTNVINTGEQETVEFVADKVGEFEYYCSVGNHRELGMRGKFIVE